eukprot:COSAG06_NODE_46507_length_346_cov_0.858300_1_plen_88_part_01
MMADGTSRADRACASGWCAVFAMVRAAPLLSLATHAAGRGAVTFPKNAADGALEPWKSWYWKPGMTEHGVDAAVGGTRHSQKYRYKQN